MYIHRLRIENLRCFERAEFEFNLPLGPDVPINDWSVFKQIKASPSPDSSLRTPNLTLLLGDNGAGKTTVLRAVALCLLADVMENSGLVLYRLVRRKSNKRVAKASIYGYTRQHEQDEPRYGGEEIWDKLDTFVPEVGPENQGVGGDLLETIIERRGDFETMSFNNYSESGRYGLFAEESPAFFVLGYGATRRAESSENFDSGARSKTRTVRYQRVAGLFEEHMTLVPLSSWLPGVEDEFPERFDEVRGLLNALLPDKVELLSARRGETSQTPSVNTMKSPHSAGPSSSDRYLFRFDESEVPFAALSDGYRAYIGWLGDMLYHLNSACPLAMKLADCRGVVMVDEVDLHLHPSWQRVVVDTLSQTFPRLQFILTTHSPIVAGTLEAGNIWVMETNDDGSVSPQRYKERIFGLSADQILTSSYFNLLTTRAPQAEKEIRALAHQAGQGDEGASLEALRRLSGSIDGEQLSDAEIVVP